MRGIEDELLARWAERYREQKGILVGPLYQGFARRWVNRRPFGAHIFRHERGIETGDFISRQFPREAFGRKLELSLP
jgi:hypothetical protein